MTGALLASLALGVQGVGANPSAANGVLHRVLGPRASAFHFVTIPAINGHEAFQVNASHGSVEVQGSSSVAMCRGAYDYLKKACGCQVSWSGDNVSLPKALPDWEGERTVCPNTYRHYFNVCTFGYTMVWWDWERWQHEIDWMALHGINMPLAMNGQEKVWQTVFRKLGEPERSIQAHFSGPAFLPWHRMGNLDQHMGPLPQSWIDGQAALQKKILRRERELGMKPVVPGFSGFVPVDFDKIHPDVHLSSPTAWAGFAPTKFVDPLSPAFVKIGKLFIDEYRKEFGSDHLYLCDTFNEQDPQFPPESELADLKATGRAIYDSIRSADPEGIWVMQGWLFYNDRNYWKPERTAAMLGGVPAGKLITLDLASNEHEVWRDQPAVKDGGYIFNTLHNYGQRTNLFGDLQHYADVAYTSLNDPNHGRWLGMGLTPEGIDQNPVVYELMTDLMWRSDHVNVRLWLPGYAASRYGDSRDDSLVTWNMLLDTVYGSSTPWYRESWRMRPRLGANMPSLDLAKVVLADAHLVQLRVGLNPVRSPLYFRDLVDVTKTWLSGLAEQRLAAALNSYDDDKGAYKTYKSQFFAMLLDLDRLMATRPEHRLSTWIQAARAWGKTPAEKDFMERNARMQITVWGGPELFDYANKEWAGLNQDFMRKRWEMFFSALESAGSTDTMKDPDFAKWETAWAMSTKPIEESKPEDPWTVCCELIGKYGKEPTSMESLLHIDANPGIAVGKPVTDSGGTEGTHRPELVVDGKISGDYWAASPAPQWVQIDLQSSRSVSGVWLFPYFGDGRYYQYRIDVSTDGSHWTTVVDGSKNITPSSFRGYRHAFAPVSARYVRVTMLKNSANVGVHLYEVRVFGS